jgi:flavin-dependent dehydrogenase
VLETVDVLVVGGGSAGIGAAIGAARTGAKTLLIENHSFFGGVAAWALVDAIGLGGVTGALVAAVVGMAIAVAAWIVGTSLLRMLGGRRNG